MRGDGDKFVFEFGGILGILSWCLYVFFKEKRKYFLVFVVWSGCKDKIFGIVKFGV